MTSSPFRGMTDLEVLERMRASLLKEAAALPGSIERAMAGAAYNAARDEMDRRMYDHVVAMVQAQQQHEWDQDPD